MSSCCEALSSGCRSQQALSLFALRELGLTMVFTVAGIVHLLAQPSSLSLSCPLEPDGLRRHDFDVTPLLTAGQ